MAKLYFRYGSVGSAKTLNLLAVAHNYEQQDKCAYIFKPEIDVRFGKKTVRSRSGLEKKAHVIINDETNFETLDLSGVHCILVDECQFLSEIQIIQLKNISTTYDIPVICYGLRTDFRGQLFQGSKALFEVADSIEEVKNTCYFCNSKAIFNIKLVDGKPSLVGGQVELGCEETYLPCCSKCFSHKHGLSWPDIHRNRQPSN